MSFERQSGDDKKGGKGYLMEERKMFAENFPFIHSWWEGLVGFEIGLNKQNN